MHSRPLVTLAVLIVAAACSAGFALAAGEPLPTVPAGFRIERIGTVRAARELAVTPNGDLLVGTYGTTIAIVPDAEGNAEAPRVFATIDDAPVAGVALAGGTLYAGGQFGVYRMPYERGDRAARAKPEKIASVRTNGVSRDHTTVTVAVAKGKLYASVGSSCNACDPEQDATRATIQEMELDGKAMHARAVDIRNAIALTVAPGGELWAGVAGRDDLAHGHPYEIFDDVTSHAGTPDYGWLTCYDDRKPIAHANCSGVVVPKAAFPAYATPIGAVFYPLNPRGAHAFPAAYRGGAFVALHGSWHTPPVAPRVAFVAFRDGNPARGVDWSNPDAQWSDFLSGCQAANGARSCRPTGVAVGNDGSLFVADDATGSIYRIRPAR